jgi:hypothetical protein
VLGRCVAKFAATYILSLVVHECNVEVTMAACIMKNGWCVWLRCHLASAHLAVGFLV